MTKILYFRTVIQFFPTFSMHTNPATLRRRSFILHFICLFLIALVGFLLTRLAFKGGVVWFGISILALSVFSLCYLFWMSGRPRQWYHLPLNRGLRVVYHARIIEDSLTGHGYSQLAIGSPYLFRVYTFPILLDPNIQGFRDKDEPKRVMLLDEASSAEFVREQNTVPVFVGQLLA